MAKLLPLTGAYAVAEAMRQIEPDVVAAYPITPQTPIVERFATFVANGLVKTELVRVESEHSAMSACVGASAAGARAMTATSSAGLALMWEILGVASGLRLPIVMPVVNRALSAPINIHCDHSDSMGASTLGWIQFYCESAQEAYESLLIALKLAEDKEIMLPAMVMQDGFITSHGVEPVKIYDDELVKEFIGSYEPDFTLLDIKRPVTFGPLELTDYYFETKRQQAIAMERVKEKYIGISREFEKKFGSKHGFFETYKLDDADVAIVTMSSAAGTVKTVVDRLRANGKKVGLLKIKMFRPFLHKEIANALKDVKVIGTMDRSMSFGSYPPLFSEIRNALFDLDAKPLLQSYVFGLGGRELYEKDIANIFNELLEKKVSKTVKFVGCRGD